MPWSDEAVKAAAKAYAKACQDNVTENGRMRHALDAAAAVRARTEVSVPMIAVTGNGLGVCLSGRYRAWLMRRHADGYWVTVRKLEEADPAKGDPFSVLSASGGNRE